MVRTRNKPNQAILNLNQQIEVARPQILGGIVILKMDLRRIKTMVARIQQPNSFFNSIGYTFIGIAATFFASVLILPNGVFPKSVCWTIFLVSVVVVILSFTISHFQHKGLQDSKENVLDELDFIERKYGGK